MNHCGRPEGPCKEWKGTINTHGYGVIGMRRKGFHIQFLVQKLAVLLDGRKYPKGYVTDHLCKNRACYNPDHLEVVLNGENVMRGDSFAPKNKAKTHCFRGHEYAKHGRTSLQKNGREARSCRTCQQMLYRTRYYENKTKQL